GDVRDLEDELQILRDAELQGEATLFFASESSQRGADLVRTADSHAGNRESSIRLRHRFVRRARRHVHSDDSDTWDDSALRIFDDAGDRGGGDALRRRWDRRTDKCQ